MNIKTAIFAGAGYLLFRGSGSAIIDIIWFVIKVLIATAIFTECRSCVYSITGGPDEQEIAVAELIGNGDLKTQAELAYDDTTILDEWQEKRAGKENSKTTKEAKSKKEVAPSRNFVEIIQQENVELRDIVYKSYSNPLITQFATVIQGNNKARADMYYRLVKKSILSSIKQELSEKVIVDIADFVEVLRQSPNKISPEKERMLVKLEQTMVNLQNSIAADAQGD